MKTNKIILPMLSDLAAEFKGQPVYQLKKMLSEKYNITDEDFANSIATVIVEFNSIEDRLDSMFERTKKSRIINSKRNKKDNNVDLPPMNIDAIKEVERLANHNIDNDSYQLHCSITKEEWLKNQRSTVVKLMVMDTNTPDDRFVEEYLIPILKPTTNVISFPYPENSNDRIQITMDAMDETGCFKNLHQQGLEAWFENTPKVYEYKLEDLKSAPQLARAMVYAMSKAHNLFQVSEQEMATAYARVPADILTALKHSIIKALEIDSEVFTDNNSDDCVAQIATNDIETYTQSIDNEALRNSLIEISVTLDTLYTIWCIKNR